MKTDLHIHSNYSSDGQHSIEEILDFIKQKSVNLFSITDHNTIKGVRHCLKYCNETDSFDNTINFITGIEFSTYHKEVEIHLLAYGFDINLSILDELLEEFKINRVKQTELRVKELQKLGLTIDYDSLNRFANGKTPSGVTFLNYLKRFDENLEIIKEYIEGEKSESPYTNFYFDFFFRGGKAFVYVPLLDYKEVINKLKNHAVLVLAHPGLYPQNLINELVSLDIDGIEVYSSYHNQDKVNYFSNIADKNNLMIFSGSDFHGDKIKPGIEIGSISSLSEKDLNRLILLFKQKSLKSYKLLY
jgi:predicted metal-dependent phosphoesterase TrpH